MRPLTICILISLSLSVAGCARKQAVSTLPRAETASADSRSAASDSDVVELPRLQAEMVATTGSDTVYFEINRSELDAEHRRVLERHAIWRRANPSVRVSVEGHADERGTREYSQALGERRSQAASDYLAALGIARTRLLVVSWGKERLADPGTGEQAWARNRRAVSILVQ